MRWIAVVLSISALGGCGLAGAGRNDGFAPGKWQVEGWLESGQGSTQGTPAAGAAQTVNLTKDQAANPPETVFFSNFYNGEKDWSNVNFRNGNVSGSLQHGQASTPVSGTYSRDHFRVTLSFGANVDQVVEGKLVEPQG